MKLEGAWENIIKGWKRSYRRSRKIKGEISEVEKGNQGIWETKPGKLRGKSERVLRGNQKSWEGKSERV